MEEPSNPMPSVMASSNSDGRMAKLFSTPKISVNQIWIKLICLSFTA